MGLLGAIGRFGSRVVGGIDNAAYNSLGGGLLGSALPQPPQQTPEQQAWGGGLIGDGATDENQMAQQGAPPPQQPQKWTPDPQQRSQLRSQYLGSIGAALSRAAHGEPLDINGAIQQYQQNTLGQLQAAQQAALSRQRQQMLGQFQQEAAAAAGDPRRLQAVTAKWAPFFPKEVKDLGDSIHALDPKTDKVVGATFEGIGADGKKILLMKTESGQVIPVTGYTPPKPNLSSSGNMVYDPESGMSGAMTMTVGGKPRNVRQNIHTGQYLDENGQVIDTSATPVLPYEKPSADARLGDNLMLELRAQGKQTGDARVDALSPQEAAGALQRLKPPPAVNVNAGVSALDRETKQFGAKHEKSVNEANSQLEKINDARVMINGSAESQALGIPKVLTALVSGAGSGVRITQPELNQIAGARGVAGNLEGWLNSINGKGKLTSVQQAQITSILNDVENRILAKREISNDALDKINGAASRDEIIRHDTEARKRISALEAPQQKQQHQGVKTWNPKTMRFE